MLFTTWLAQTLNLAPSFVSSYIAAVCSWHIDLGAPDPTYGAARLLRGICCSCSSPALTCLPVTSRLMGVLQLVLSSPVFDHVMFWAACCTTFFSFICVSKFTCPSVYVPSRHLSVSDIQWDAGGHYHLFLKSSKMDPFYQGCTILTGPSGHPICPVAVLSRYLGRQLRRMEFIISWLAE